MSPQPADKKLYEYVKRLADKKFTSKSGIYRSSWIVREYKKRGGKYIGRKTSVKSPGLRRWYKEKWVDLNRPIKNSKGRVIGYKPCGRTSASKKSSYPLCRPSKIITKGTPRTFREISKKSIRRAKKDKSKVKHRSNIKFGGGHKQYRGRKSSVMVKVPQNVKKWAAYAFKLKTIGFRGGVDTGWRRAKQLATKESIPIEDLRYMHAWFSRHIVTSYPTYKKWKDAGRPKTKEWHNKRGIIAWQIWGGNAAFNWVNSKKNLKLLSQYFNKSYNKIKIRR